MSPVGRDVLPRERTRLRGLIILVAVAALVWAAAVGGCVAVANAEDYGPITAAESPEPTGTPAAIRLQRLSDATGVWLRGVLRADVVQRPTLVAPRLSRADNLGEFWTTTGAIYLRADVAHLLTIRGRETLGGDAASVLVHEWLHRADTYGCWVDADGTRVEEGIVHALTADLTPAWGARFWHDYSARAIVAYPREVAAIRAWSARATASPTWRTPAARAARRALWAASCEQRAAMLALAA